jgi:hypothetical protein
MRASGNLLHQAQHVAELRDLAAGLNGRAQVIGGGLMSHRRQPNAAPLTNR